MPEENLKESEVSSEKITELPPLAWVVRPCEQYKEEYKDCRSIKERFHQYFIHGDIYDCSDWKADYNSCMKYRKTGDEKALTEVIESEKERKKRRLEDHLANDIWERRKTPPLNWNSELPVPNLENASKTPSFLGIKQEEARENPLPLPEYGYRCTIL